MCEPVVITLRKPIESGKATITELTIRPVKGKDLRRLKPGDPPVVQTLNMLSWLSGQPMQVIDELEGDDIGKAMAVVNDFLFATQGTGEKHSDSSSSGSLDNSSPA